MSQEFPFSGPLKAQIPQRSTKAETTDPPVVTELTVDCERPTYVKEVCIYHITSDPIPEVSLLCCLMPRSSVTNGLHVTH